MLKRHNPFSTRYVRPGAISYLFPDDTTLRDLVERFQSNQFRGEIIGPHGSGKSTLLQALINELERLDFGVATFVLKQGPRSLSGGIEDVRALESKSIVVIDGYEQLSWYQRWRICSVCRKQRFGLLITSHQSYGLPNLWRTAPSLEITSELVRQLDDRIPAEHIDQLFHKCKGDIREVFFKLYDVWENDNH